MLPILTILKTDIISILQMRKGNAESSDGLSTTTQLINDRGEIWTRSNPPSTHGFLNKSPLQGFYRFVLRSIDFNVNPQPLLILKRFSTLSGFCSFSLFQSTDGFLEARKSSFFKCHCFCTAETQISVSLPWIIRQTMKTRHEISVPNLICVLGSYIWHVKV